MRSTIIINLSKLRQGQTKVFKMSVFPTLKLFLLISILSFSSCKQNSETTPEKKPKNVPLVEVQSVKKTKMVSFINITGTIEANIYTDVKSSADGILEELSVRENQWVKKDKIIAIINPDDRVALISNNQLQVQQLENKLEEHPENSGEYSDILEELEEARSNLEYAKEMYQTIPVICPMSGLVTHRWTDTGSQVRVQDKIITISDMSSLVIKAQVNEKYFETLRRGKKLGIELNAYPNDSVTGTISLIYPTIDPENRTVEFDVRITEFNKKLLPGMMASIKIPVTEIEDAVAVPEQAILTTPDNKNFLFVVDSDNVAHRRMVEKGITSVDGIEVKQGLSAGESVVVSGQEMLKDNVMVKILKNE